MGVGLSAAYASVMDGIHRGTARAAEAAQTLAEDVDVDAIIDLSLAQTQVAAAAKVSQVLDEMVGTLVNTTG